LAGFFAAGFFAAGFFAAVFFAAGFFAAGFFAAVFFAAGFFAAGFFAAVFVAGAIFLSPLTGCFLPITLAAVGLPDTADPPPLDMFFPELFITACAPASRASGTRNGEHET
jgi:hypothetical protein